VRHAGAYVGEDPIWNTRAFDISTSVDGSNFTTAVSVTANTANVTTHNIALTSARYVRLNVITPTNSSDTATRIYELEVYGAAGGDGGTGVLVAHRVALRVARVAHRVAHRVARAVHRVARRCIGWLGRCIGWLGRGQCYESGPAEDSHGSTPCANNETPAKAVNGTVNGGYSDKFCSLAPSAFLQVDLGSVLSVAQITVKHASAGAEDPIGNTRDFNLQVSTNGSTFSNVATVTGNTAGTTVHSFPVTSARYVRMNIITPTSSTDQAVRIYEFEVRGP